MTSQSFTPIDLEGFTFLHPQNAEFVLKKTRAINEETEVYANLDKQLKKGNKQFPKIFSGIFLSFFATLLPISTVSEVVRFLNNFDNVHWFSRIVSLAVIILFGLFLCYLTVLIFTVTVSTIYLAFVQDRVSANYRWICRFRQLEIGKVFLVNDFENGYRSISYTLTDDNNMIEAFTYVTKESIPLPYGTKILVATNTFVKVVL